MLNSDFNLQAPSGDAVQRPQSHAYGTNGSAAEPTDRAPYRPVSSTLPQGAAPPPHGEMTKAASLDRSAKAPQGPLVRGTEKGDKKRHSMFGGLFKKKKDKESK